MEKRNYPLFIIDTSRAHGRGRETDYICCTDNECGFTASIELVRESEYAKEYDKNDYTTIWSDRHTHNNIRVKISIVSPPPDNKERTKSLLRRALKEFQIRKHPLSVDTDNISKDAVVRYAEIMSSKCMEDIRIEGETELNKMIMSILLKIKKDYSE